MKTQIDIMLFLVFLIEAALAATAQQVQQLYSHLFNDYDCNAYPGEGTDIAM